MPKEIRCALAWLFSGMLICCIAYWFIDKPAAFWIFNHQYNQIPLVKKVTYIPVFIVVITVLTYVWLIFRFAEDRYRLAEKNALLLVNSVALTYLLKSAFKAFFGRYWPVTWIHHNPSLISNGVYGFNWFHVGSAYGAFPSGHSAVMAAGMTALSLSYPKAWWFFASLWLIVAVGLLGMNYHFFSDIIGGGALGAFAACCTKYTLQFSPYNKNLIRNQKIRKL